MRRGQRLEVVDVEPVGLEDDGQELPLLHRDFHVLHARLEALREADDRLRRRVDVPEADVASLPVVLLDHRLLHVRRDRPGLEVDGDRAGEDLVQHAALVVGRRLRRHLEKMGMQPTGLGQDLLPLDRPRQEVEERLGIAPKVQHPADHRVQHIRVLDEAELSAVEGRLAAELRGHGDSTDHDAGRDGLVEKGGDVAYSRRREHRRLELGRRDRLLQRGLGQAEILPGAVLRDRRGSGGQQDDGEYGAPLHAPVSHAWAIRL